MNLLLKSSLIASFFLSITTSLEINSKAETLNYPNYRHDLPIKYSDCLSFWKLVRSNDSFNDLYSQGRYIERTAGVEIIWQITPKSFPVLWSTAPQNMRANNLSIAEVKRHLNIVKRALAKYSPDLIKHSFHKIYLLTNLEVYNSKFDGFYLGEERAIYLNNTGAENGHNDLYLEGVLHHEISSFLFYRYATPEFKAKWQQHNPQNFQYSGGNGIDYYRQAIDLGLSTNEIREDCLQDGFLNIYARSNLENDFNEIAERIFTDREHLWQLASQHQKLKYKLELFIELYTSIDPRFKTQFASI